MADVLTLTAEEFEILVRDVLQKYAHRYRGAGLRLDVTGKRPMEGLDGEYEIDATARMLIFDGLEVVFLIECKNHRRPVSRDYVMTLAQKLLSVPGHKGIMFSTNGYQRAAIQFAKAHGIALVQWKAGRWTRVAKAGPKPPEGYDLPCYHPVLVLDDGERGIVERELESRPDSGIDALVALDGVLELRPEHG